MAQPVIGIDASRATGRIRTGTENYSLQIIRGLVATPSAATWRLYLNEPGEIFAGPTPANADIRRIPSPRLWTHLRLSAELMFNRVKGLFVPAHVVPLYHPATVVTLHDVGYVHHPELHPANQRRMLDLTTRWSARAARHIIVPSQQTADDLARFYRVPETKMTVIHHGIDPRMNPASDDTDETLAGNYGLNRPFVLAVGTLHPRKNLGVLARAMKQVISGNDVDLVIAGRPGWMYEQVLAELEGAELGDRLRLLSYIPDADLPALYRAASVFVQPSKFEGFGMPVLEAMASGTPVITALGSSLDEVGANAAIQFEGDDDSALAEAITRLLTDESARETAITQGLERSRAFTWEQASEKTRIVLEKYLLH